MKRIHNYGKALVVVGYDGKLHCIEKPAKLFEDGQEWALEYFNEEEWSKSYDVKRGIYKADYVVNCYESHTPDGSEYDAEDYFDNFEFLQELPAL